MLLFRMNNMEGGVMLVLTTPTIEGRKIVKYLGLVSGEAILDANGTAVVYE